MRLLLVVGVLGSLLLSTAGCPGGDGTGTGGGAGGAFGGGGGGGGGGGAGGGSGGAFLFDRSSESSAPQVARDGAGVLHLLVAPAALDAQGHAYVRYARCAAGCEGPGGWAAVTLADGPLAGDVKLAVEASGVVHTAELSGAGVRFGRCAADCTQAASWTFNLITAPGGVTWTRLPRGRAFAVSAAGRERLLLHGNAGAGAQLLLLGTDGAGWTVDPLVDGEVSAVSLLSTGAGAHLVATRAAGPFNLTYAECSANCGAVGSWSQAEVLASNAYAVGLDRGAGGELHVAWTNSQGAADALMYARCASQCLTPGSWASVALGDGNDGRGGLDVSVRPSGAVAIAGATPAGAAQTLNLRRCAGNCTAAGSWSGGQLEAGAAVADAHPSFNGASCSEPQTLRSWAVGEAAQLVPTAAGWLLGYDATSYSACQGASTTHYVSGRWVRLQAQPAP